MNIPSELKFTKEHEWVRVENNKVVVGISDHAQHELGDIVFLDIQKKVGEVVKKGQTVGTVESVKTLSDVYAPVSGTIVRVNAGLADSPASVNEEPYGGGWLVEIELSDAAELTTLLTAEQYQEYLKASDH